MTKATRAAWLALGMSVAIGASAHAQQPTKSYAGVGDCEMTAAQAAEAEHTSGASTRICSATVPGFTSDAESTAFQSLQAMAHDPQTTPAAMDAAVAQYLAGYPTSAFRSQAATVGVRYYVSKNDYAHMVSMGKLALETDPQNLYVLSVLAVAEAGHIQDSDLDRDAELQQADAYSNTLLAALKTFTWDPMNGMDYKGTHIPAAEAEAQKAGYTGAAFGALGRTAMVRKQYALAATQYQRAIEAVPAAQAAIDHYYRGQAEAALGNRDAATADYNAALANPGNNPAVAAAVKAALAALPTSGHDR